MVEIGLAVLIQYRSVTDTQPPSQPATQPRCRIAITLNALAKASSLKSCALCIGKTVPNTPLSISGASLSYVSSCRDLGVIVTSDLTSSDHINDTVCSKHTSKLMPYIDVVISINIDLLVRTYRVYVRPLLLLFGLLALNAISKPLKEF